jgi:phosphoketolase
LSNRHKYWRACNYLAARMIYLRDNPLLRESLKLDQGQPVDVATKRMHTHKKMIYIDGRKTQQCLLIFTTKTS